MITESLFDGHGRRFFGIKHRYRSLRYARLTLLIAEGAVKYSFFLLVGSSSDSLKKADRILLFSIAGQYSTAYFYKILYIECISACKGIQLARFLIAPFY